MRAAMRALLGAALIFGSLASGAGGQDLDDFRIDPEEPVALVADRVAFDEEAETVTATGGVEVYQGLRTLTADEIVYDARADRISARGPLTLRDPSGVTVFADFAELDAELREGVIRGARAFIGEGEATVAAVEARRVGDRYTAFSKAVYSSCAVCPEAPTPLWSIRARRVVHDEAARVVYFEGAVFEVLGAPVGWLPFFSMPDPTVERLSGFLVPTFLRSDRYGEAVKAPYFLVLGPTRDATLTPFLTTKDGPILEAEYRERLDLGAFELAGSLGHVGMESDEDREIRGHFFGEGVFEAGPIGFGEGSEVGFDIEFATDDGYLRRYDYTDRDRLESELFARRYGERGFYEVNGVRFQSLREEEPDDEIPLVLPEFALRQPLPAPEAFGDFSLDLSGVALTRIEGRDLRRLTGALDWEKRAALASGFVARGFALARADLYSIEDDPDDDGFVARLAPHAGVELSYPLIATPEWGTHLLEPLAQFVAAPTGLNDDIPNEDSLIVEFDEKNLFDVNRFPGYDRVETGMRANVGLRYSFVGAEGLTVEAAGGRVLRFTGENAFSGDSGLSGERSDWVAAWSARLDERFSLTHRIRISDELDLARNEVVGSVDFGRARVSASYVFLEEDAQAGALDDRSEYTLGGELDVTPFVTVGGFVRRDLVADEYIDVEAAIGYRNECAALQVYAERDFTDTEDAPAATTVGLRVRLFGLADGAGPRSGVCAIPTHAE